MSVKTVSIGDTHYPENLRNIYNPPDEIFVKGDFLARDNDAIAIVGTRRPTYYGLRQAEKFSYELALRGLTIISGLARGIDTAAHKGALKAGGRTIAVLGNGHNYIYPPENKKLYSEIENKGIIISEYPPETPPLKANFPRRNRIISGLSRGVIVIEAPLKSGALITSNFALEQNREVFAIPGNVDSSKSAGSNKLIKDGAKLVENIKDILEELESVLDIEDAIKAPTSQGLAEKDNSFSLDEELVFNTLDLNEASTIDQISGKTNFSASRVSQILLRLELKRLVKVLPGATFVRR